MNFRKTFKGLRGVILVPKNYVADFGPLRLFSEVFRKKLQHTFPKMREGVKGRLESFRKIIRFGSPKRPFKGCLLNSDYLISPTIYSYRKQDKKWEKWNVVPSCWCPYLDQIRWICHWFHTSGQIHWREKKEKSTAINRCSCLSSVGQWRCVKIESKLVYLSRYLAPCLSRIRADSNRILISFMSVFFLPRILFVTVHCVSALIVYISVPR